VASINSKSDKKESHVAANKLSSKDNKILSKVSSGKIGSRQSQVLSKNESQKLTNKKGSVYKEDFDDDGNYNNRYDNTQSNNFGEFELNEEPEVIASSYDKNAEIARN